MFENVLAKRNLDWVISTPNREFPVFIQEKTLMFHLEKIVRERLRVLLYGDYDCDGAYTREIWKMIFHYVGHTNFEAFQYLKRTHSVDPMAINRAIQGRFDYIIICDAGSSDPETILKLKGYGVEVILLDHHETPYNYSTFEGIHMVNTTIENRTRIDEITVSAGALVYIVGYKLCMHLGVKPLESTAALALASLYADSIDMSGDIQRNIYYRATSLDPTELPPLLQRFMIAPDTNKPSVYKARPQAFVRRYLEFTVNPRLNALIRSERFGLLNQLLDWTPDSETSVSELVIKTMNHHAEIRKELKTASDIITSKEMGRIVYGNLSSVIGQVKIPGESLSNYTGLVASDLVGRFGKTGVVLADTGTDFKGSLRASMGQDYLSRFKLFCNAGGHKPAFGFTLKYYEKEDFFEYLYAIGNEKSSMESAETLILPYNKDIPDPDDISVMALYNEFAGSTVPKVYLQKLWTSGEKPHRTSFSLLYSWGDFKINTRNFTEIKKYSTLILQPTKGNTYQKNRGVSLELKVGGIW